MRVMGLLVMDFIDVMDFRGFEKNIWEVLVGAFSDFGGLDTDNPVQILGFLRVSEVFLKCEGLI